jgi:hypothetical protein
MPTNTQAIERTAGFLLQYHQKADANKYTDNRTHGRFSVAKRI